MSLIYIYAHTHIHIYTHMYSKKKGTELNGIVVVSCAPYVFLIQAVEEKE